MACDIGLQFELPLFHFQSRCLLMCLEIKQMLAQMFGSLWEVAWSTWLLLDPALAFAVIWEKHKLVNTLSLFVLCIYAFQINISGKKKKPKNRNNWVNKPHIWVDLQKIHDKQRIVKKRIKHFKKCSHLENLS